MKKVLKWAILTAGFVVGIPFIGFVLFAGVMILGFQQSGEPPDFTGYKADIPLAGSTIVETRVRKGYSSSPKPSGPTYEQTYDSGVEVVQVGTRDLTSDIVCDPISFSSYTSDCREGNISKGEYAVTTIYSEGELFDVKVSARIHGTKIYMTIPEKARKQVAEYVEWDDYFDSMEPVDLTKNNLLDRLYSGVKFLTFQK